MVKPRHGVARDVDVARGVAGHLSEDFVGLEVEDLDRAACHPQRPLLRNHMVFEGHRIAGRGLARGGGLVERPVVYVHIVCRIFLEFCFAGDRILPSSRFHRPGISIPLPVLGVEDFDPAVTGKAARGMARVDLTSMLLVNRSLAWMFVAKE